MTHVIQTGLIALLVFSPLAFGSVEVWAKSVVEFAAFGLLGLWLVHDGFYDGAAPARLPGPLIVLTALFAGLGLYQWLGSASLYPRGTREALVLGSAYAAVFWLVITTVRKDEEIDRIVLALIGIGFAVAVFSILQRYTWNGKIYWLRSVADGGSATGPFVNRNHFAGYIEMLIPVAIGYTVAAFAGAPPKGATAWQRFVYKLTSEASNKLILLLFMTVVMSVSLVLSLSRAGIVSFLTALILVGTILLLGRTTQRWVMLPGVLVMAVLIALTWFGLGPLIDRYQTLLNLGEDAAMKGRVEVWMDAGRMVRDHPIAGIGLGAFGAVYPVYKTSSHQVMFDHAHNDYVQFLTETGWAGFALGAGILGIVTGFVMAGWQQRRNPRARGLLMGIGVGITAFLVHAFNDFNFHIPSNALLFVVLMALAWNLAWPERTRAVPYPVVSRRRTAMAVAGLAVVGLLLYDSSVVFAADRHYRCGRTLEAKGDYDRASGEYRHAIRWDPAQPLYHLALGKIYERRYAGGEPAFLDSARLEMERAIEVAPTLAEPHLHLGWIYAQRGEVEAATAALREALRLDPTNNNVRHYVGLWFAATGQTDEALRLVHQLREAGRADRAGEIEERLGGSGS